MDPKTPSSVAVFEEVLRAYETGGFTYSDVLAQLKRLLANGASPTELLERLRRRELIEPLPKAAHAEVLGLLNDAKEQAAAQTADADTASDQVPDAIPAAEPARTQALEGRATAGTQLEGDLRAARARASALVAELAAAKTALESEQSKTREIGKALLEKEAAADAASLRGEEALRELARHQGESRALRGSLAARDATIGQMRHSLTERDAQLVALQREHVALVSELEARAKTGSLSEANLQEARARAEAISLRLKTGQEAADALGAQLKRSESQLNAVRAELEAVKAQSSAYLESLRTRDWQHEFDQNAVRELNARADAADRGREALQAERDQLQARVVSLQAQMASLQLQIEARDVALNARAAADAEAQREAELQTVPIAEVESAQPARTVQWAAATETPEIPEREIRDREAPAPEILDREIPEQPVSGTMDDSIRVGDVLADRYWLAALIGEGASSRVYKATDSAGAQALQDSFTAVKVLTRPLTKDYESFVANVRRLRGLVHPNIARVLDCGRDGPVVFVTSEYVAGQSLRTLLRDGTAARSPRSRLDRAEARTIISGIANALDYAHRNEVVHGDLNLQNVIVIGRGVIKVVDFDMARWVTGDSPKPIDDVYALACLAYELMTGVHPFAAGGAQSLKPPPRRRMRLSSPQYSALVHGLQHDRRKRTPTVSQFVDEFSASKRGATWKPGAIALAKGLSAMVLVVAAVAWFFGHHAALPPPMPPASSAAVAKPGAVIRDCPTCPSMTVLPAGRFKQGSAGAAGGAAAFERPLHWVAIGRPFAMSTNDVTVDEFGEFIAASGRDMRGCDTYDGVWKHEPKSSWKDPGFVQNGTHPVTCASWQDAEAYAAWLSTKTGHRYRLPSASEWEYAARAGTEAVQPWSADGSDACANANVADESAARRYPGWTVFACNDGYVYTAPVGSFKANSLGLYDMLGNVFQWTEDCWHMNYTGAPIDGSARTDGNCSERELRGGSWFSTPAYVRANYRNHFAADYRTSSVGIRLVREVEK